ncbi:MAG: hypothetical protein K2G88_09810 [Oscillospiraceae bacterium]|nr:hypothetical protein [Oscillospiraceae bacterium]
MQDLIKNYENCRLLLQSRIYELNKLLRNNTLQTIERQTLTTRRDMLVTERTELSLAIIDMRKHIKFH